MSQDLQALLALNQIPGFGVQTFKKYLQDFRTPAEILRVCSGQEKWAPEIETLLERWRPEREMEDASRQGIQILGYGQEGYPEVLCDLYDPPLILYVRGTLLPQDFLYFAIVGSRMPSLYGLSMARKFSNFLASAGLTIVSGFARGIDSEAHRAALECKGRTVAVLGCGVEKVYPRENEELYHRVLENGALVSEYGLGTEPLGSHFPRRNRLISGFSVGVLVVEAHEKSGSLITAGLAMEQGKEVFALPGRVDSLTSRGTNRLIKAGACLVESPEEILAELAPVLKGYLGTPRSAPSHPIRIETDPLLAALREFPRTLDELSAKTADSPEQLAARLTHLELDRKVKKRLDGRFALVDVE